LRLLAERGQAHARWREVADSLRDRFRDVAELIDDLTSARIVSWAFAELRSPGSAIIAYLPRKPTSLLERRRSQSGGGVEHDGLPILLLPSDHSPERADRLVSNGHCRNIDRTPANQSLKPWAR